MVGFTAIHKIPAILGPNVLHFIMQMDLDVYVLEGITISMKIQETLSNSLSRSTFLSPHLSLSLSVCLFDRMYVYVLSSILIEFNSLLKSC